MSDIVGADGAAVMAVDAYGPRPQWRGRLHQYAFFVSLPAGFWLLRSAHSVSAQVAVAIYWASLAGLFGASASYHLLARSERAVKWMRRLDHSMIFMLIAGTYTPICLVVLPRAWGLEGSSYERLLFSSLLSAGANLKLVSESVDTYNNLTLAVDLGVQAHHARRATDDPAGGGRGALHRRRDHPRQTTTEPVTDDLRLPRGVARPDHPRRWQSLRHGVPGRPLIDRPGGTGRGTAGWWRPTDSGSCHQPAEVVTSGRDRCRPDQARVTCASTPSASAAIPARPRQSPRSVCSVGPVSPRCGAYQAGGGVPSCANARVQSA